MLKIEHCSFCKKTSKEVSVLFSSNEKGSSLICGGCVVKMSAALKSGVSGVEQTAKGVNHNRRSILPKDIYKKVMENFIGQEEVVKKMSVAIYNHMKRLKVKDGDKSFEKSNILLGGETGTGKTFLTKIIAETLNIPYVMFDATRLTQAGYVGSSVEDIIQDLIAASGGNLQKAESGIIFLDEIDKIYATGGSGSLDVGGKGVQQALLKMIEGTKITIKSNQGDVIFDTSNVLFVCSGAFVGIGGKKRAQIFQYGAVESDKKEDTQLTQESLERFGLIPELIGRLPIRVYLKPHTVETMKDIITKPKKSILKQYKNMLEADGIELKITPDAVEKIAEKAINSKTGARGIREIFEDILATPMFTLPGSDITTLTIFVRGGEITYKTSTEKIQKVDDEKGLVRSTTA